MFEYLFIDRKDAGSQLAKKLISFKDKKNTIVVALARGGVITAHETAKLLNLPLDIIIPRKLERQ